MRATFLFAFLLLTAPAHSAEVPIDLLALIEKTRVAEPELAPPPAKELPIVISVVKQKPANGLKWDAKNHRWLSADGRTWAAPGSTHWQPVKVAATQYNRTPRGNVAYVEPNTRAAYLLHLSQDHGFDRAWLETQDDQQLFALHSDAHYDNVDGSRVKYRDDCPNGQCARSAPTIRNSRTVQPRGIFRRR